MKTLLYILALLNCQVFLCGSLAAQPKSEQVQAYLGPNYESPAPNGTVKFRFAKMELRRDGDGKKTYAQLLRNVTGYSDADDMGPLRAIHVEYVRDGRVRVAEVPRVEIAPVYVASVTGDPVRPRSAYEITDTTAGIPLDSAGMAALADKTIRAIDRAGEVAGQAGQPLWRVVMHLFNKALVWLILLIGLLRLVAKTSAGESAVNRYGQSVIGRYLLPVHQWACFVILACCWLVAGVTLINLYFWFRALGWPTWMVVIPWVIVIAISEWLINRIVPDVRVIGAGIRYGEDSGLPGLNHGGRR